MLWLSDTWRLGEACAGASPCNGSGKQHISGIWRDSGRGCWQLYEQDRTLFFLSVDLLVTAASLFSQFTEELSNTVTTPNRALKTSEHSLMLSDFRRLAFCFLATQTNTRKGNYWNQNLMPSPVADQEVTRSLEASFFIFRSSQLTAQT